MPFSFIATTFWIYLGLLFRSFGNQFAWRQGYRWAISCFSRGLHHDPDNPYLYYWRGTLYWRELGDCRQAEADLSRAIALAPRMARAYLNRAFARWYASPPDRAGAAEDFRAYLERDQDPYWRQVALEHLQKLGEG
ncbi:MAG: hypothetical protein ACP5OO_11460 [Chloroflexia bacterium]